MVLDVFTDGGSKGNPGPAAIGVAFYEGKNRIDTYREDIGHATNNEAEYTAVIRALEIIRDKMHQWNHVTEVRHFADSQLVVQQLKGVYKIKQPHIRVFIDKIHALKQQLKIPISHTYIPREQNSVADALVNNAL